MSDFEKRAPDYRLAATHKKTKTRSILGTAWINEEGFISIHLGPCVVIDSNFSHEFHLSLLPKSKPWPT